MIEDLMKMLQNTGQESVVNNPEVPNEHNEGVLASAQSSIMDTIKSMVANGQGADVAKLADASNPEAQQLQSGFVQNIMDKFGIKGDAANNIASNLIPQVMSKLNQGGQGIDLNSITSMFNKTGLDKDGDGDVDLNDVKKMIGF